MTTTPMEELRAALVREVATLPVRDDPYDLVSERIVELRRRRRTRIRTGVACLAAAAVVTAIAVAGKGRGPNATPDPAQSPDTTAVETVVPLPRQPAEKVWPEAVHQIPKTLPDGRKIVPVAFLDTGVVVVGVNPTEDGVEALARYDVATKTATTLTELTMPGGPDRLRVMDGWIVWSMRLEGDAGEEIWGVPTAGGTASKLAQVPPANGGIVDLAVENGKLYWATSDPEAPLYVAPFGGAPAVVPNTEGHRIVSWPWIGAPSELPENGDGVLYRDLRNVATGEVRSTHQRARRWSCNLTWCTVGADGRLDPSFVERRDGTGRQRVPVSVDPFDGMAAAPVRDRFLIQNGDVYDLRTGKHGLLGLDGNQGYVNEDDRMHLNNTKDGYEVIDLAAIP